MLARTEPDVIRHAGLTMFIVDMDTPGVTVRPLRQMTGNTHFNEVFLDEVRVADDNRSASWAAGGPWSTPACASEPVGIRRQQLGLSTRSDG